MEFQFHKLYDPLEFGMQTWNCKIQLYIQFKYKFRIIQKNWNWDMGLEHAGTHHARDETLHCAHTLLIPVPQHQCRSKCGELGAFYVQAKVFEETPEHKFFSLQSYFWLRQP